MDSGNPEETLDVAIEFLRSQNSEDHTRIVFDRWRGN